MMKPDPERRVYSLLPADRHDYSRQIHREADQSALLRQWSAQQAHIRVKSEGQDPNLNQPWWTRQSDEERLARLKRAHDRVLSSHHGGSGSSSHAIVGSGAVRRMMPSSSSTPFDPELVARRAAAGLIGLERCDTAVFGDDAVTGNYSDRTEFERLQAAVLNDVLVRHPDAFRSR
jgi:hypothetical protein